MSQKHRKIAASDHFDERRELAIWLPFVYLSSDIKNRITEEDAICLALSDGNTELMALYKKEQPFETNVSYVYNQSLKEFKFGFTRSVCVVRLHSDNPVLLCCRKTSRIIWLDIEQVLNNYMDCLWGPQFNRFLREFDEEIQKVRSDYFVNTDIFDGYTLTDHGEMLLKSVNISKKLINLFYIDFTEHCFPSLVMSFVSFKDYLGKYGFKTSEKFTKRMFNCFMLDTTLNHNSVHCLLFIDLLLGLANIDPKSLSNGSRLRFVFQYYDIDRDGYLSKEELREMIEDIHENETSDLIDILVADYWFIMSPSDRGVDFEIFMESVNEYTLIIPHSLCRIDFRILPKIISNLKTRNRGIVSRIKTFVSHYYC